MDNDETNKKGLLKWLTNKYVIAIALFAIVYLFVGDQSLIKRLKQEIEIHRVEEQIKDIQSQTKQDKRMMDILQDTDSLEKFAREQYQMHTDNEDVYIVE